MAQLEQIIMFGFLVMARVAPVFMGTSLSPLARIPMTIRVFIVMLVCAFITLNQDVSALPKYSDIEYGFAVLREVLFGIAMAFGIQVLYSALTFAGRIVDLQVGFGAAGIIDPLTKQSEALIGTLLTALAGLLFFTTNTHHLLLELLVRSVGVIPLGSTLSNISLSLFVSELGIQFLYGIMVVLPVIAGLLMVDVVIAFSSKTMPQMNIYFVTLPLKIFLGIVILTFSINYANPAFSRMYTHLVSYWQSVLGA